MSTIKYFVTEEPAGATFALGRSDIASRQKAFSTSPFLNGYNDVAARTALFKNVAEGIVADGPNGYFAGNASLTFRDAPDLSTVAVGGAGLPGSAFGPNIASPGEGNGLNHASIPDLAGVEATTIAAGLNSPTSELKRSGGGFGIGNGLTSPSRTTAAIVEELSPDKIVTSSGVRTLTLGMGSRDSFKKRV